MKLLDGVFCCLSLARTLGKREKGEGEEKRRGEGERRNKKGRGERKQGEGKGEKMSIMKSKRLSLVPP